MYEGGCLCGALRFSATARPIAAGYCHCTLCQRSTGAPVLAWASFPAEAFAYTKGCATHYESSSWGHREFCNLCGTQIGYRQTDGATTVDVNVIGSPGSIWRTNCRAMRSRNPVPSSLTDPSVWIRE